MKEDYNFSRIWRERKPFRHALNVTILVKKKSEYVCDLYVISTGSTFALPYM